MTVLPDRAPHTHPLPERLSFRRVAADAVEQIQRAAVTLWPGRPLTIEQHVPSVTSYVHRVHVDGETLYAKVPYLGASLVSLLRGGYGTWPEIATRQREYAATPDNLAAREAAQLRLLSTLGRPLVCRLAGVRNGVLFTAAVNGPTLTDLLLARPDAAADLLGWPLQELHDLRSPDVRHQADATRLISERSISGTFVRKFNATGTTVYIDRLGAERCPAAERPRVVEQLRRTVNRLSRLRSAVLPVARTELVYGDLKPEHVLYPDGPDGLPVLLDPGLLRSHPAADMAKLISRIALVLVAHQPQTATVDGVIQGIDTLVSGRADGMARGARHAWIRQITALWLMDTLNITTTFLSAPPDLPMPRHADALVTQVARLAALVDAVSEDLATGADAVRTWERAMSRVREVAP